MEATATAAESSSSATPFRQSAADAVLDRGNSPVGVPTTSAKPGSNKKTNVNTFVHPPGNLGPLALPHFPPPLMKTRTARSEAKLGSSCLAGELSQCCAVHTYIHSQQHVGHPWSV